MDLPKAFDTLNHTILPVADQNFIRGGRSRGKGLGGAVPLPRKKMNFYLKMVGFGAF